MKYEMIIECDTNDGDYITSTNTVTEEDLKELQPIIDAIKAFKPFKVYGHGGYIKDEDGKEYRMASRNWANGEYNDSYECAYAVYVERGILTEDQYDMFEGLTPYGEYGFHSIESITIYPLPEKRVLYNRR